MQDSDILDLYWDRDERAIAETRIRYGPYCRSIAFSILADPEDADECLSDTWFKAWNVIPPNRPLKLSVFLGRITRNLSLNKYKARSAQKRGGGEMPLLLTELNECIPDGSDVDKEVLSAELGRAINRFLSTLSRRDCSLFLLRYWYAVPLSKIAAQHSMKENSVKSCLFRCRAKLKAYLQKEGFSS